MGVFDFVKCDYPLPKGHPEWLEERGHEFQTHHFDDAYLHRYMISEGGVLSRLDDNVTTVFDDFHGDMELSAYSEAHKELITYIARFTEGKLTRIQESEREKS